MPVTDDTAARVGELLGREPRGLEEVMVSTPQGAPMVIRVASLVDDTPFPTLFWLVDSDLCYRIDRAEAAGIIAALQARVDNDASLRQRMRDDHRAYIALRESYLSPVLKARLDELGFSEVLASRGVGGIADFSRIRCLHTWYAAHLVVPNTIGELLDEYWAQPGA